jgi:hypothetical protein
MKNNQNNLSQGRSSNMDKKSGLVRMFLLVAVATALTLGINSVAAAHCDTFDGPVIQDARKAMEAQDVTPVLKWVKQKDEKVVRTAFAKAQSARGKKNADAAENKFFVTLVRIHRAGEGAFFTGLKSAGEVEPAIVEADKALTSGSSDALVKLATDDVAAGIRTRYEHAAAPYRHKDESVEQGREFVEAYVEYTHYVERLYLNATGKGPHDEHHKGSKH